MSVSIVTRALRRPIIATAFLAAGLLATAAPAKAQYYPYAVSLLRLRIWVSVRLSLLPRLSRGRLGLGPPMGLASWLALTPSLGLAPPPLVSS